MITVQPRQSIFDIALQHCGSNDAAWDIAQLNGLSTGEDFNKRFSRVSIESLLLYIVAAGIWTLEQLFDTHTAEVTDYIATMKPHTLYHLPSL